MLVAKQSYFLGKTPPDLGVAAVGEKFNKNGALYLQYGSLACTREGAVPGPLGGRILIQRNASPLPFGIEGRKGPRELAA